MKFSYLVHYGEIALKGQNRVAFEQRLAHNIRLQNPGCRVRRFRGRMLVRSDCQVHLESVFGIAWWAPVEVVAAEVDPIRRAVLQLAEGCREGVQTFAVRVRRAAKEFPITSPEMERRLGAEVQAALGWGVDLSDPDLTLFLEIASRKAFVFSRKTKGALGLPVGISGRALGLFSGGMDSALAAYLMAKRGCRIELLHFCAFADVARAHDLKAGKMARRLAQFLPAVHVHYVPYHHFQIATSMLPPPLQKQELVVFRRFMARVAESLSHTRRARALFTGDNLGQVASQTMGNLIAVDQALETSIFRPLIAYDKQEIVDACIRLGFFEIAAEDYKDCCSLIGRFPATQPRFKRIHEIESRIEMDVLVSRTLEEKVSFRIGPAVQTQT